MDVGVRFRCAPPAIELMLSQAARIRPGFNLGHNVVDELPQCCELFGVCVGDLNAKPLLNSHDEFDNFQTGMLFSLRQVWDRTLRYTQR